MDYQGFPQDTAYPCFPLAALSAQVLWVWSQP